MTSEIDITGQQFTYWTVLRRDGSSPSGHPMWLCRCRCGVQKSIQKHNLRPNGSTSCGCKTKEGLGKSRRYPGYETWVSYLWTVYKKAAKARNIEFQLSLDELKHIVILNCHYCGCEPKERKVNPTLPFKAHGIDRINSALGYAKDNCRPCCSICNTMKFDLTEQEFLNHIKQILMHHERNN